MSGERMPEIYAFVNGGSGDWWTCAALSEDGEFLAGHVCSHPNYGPHDMGATSDWKHDHYRERYPQGFTVVWVDGNPSDDERVQAAYAKHLAAGEQGTPWQQARAATHHEREAVHG